MHRHPRPEVVPVAVITLGLLLSGCSDGSDNREASADSSTSASSSPSASSPSSDPGLPHLFGSQAALAPGPYQFSFAAKPGVDAPDAIIEVPSGYTDGADWYVVPPDGDQFVGLWMIGKVARDACHPKRSELITPGPTVADLADALAAQESTRATAPKPVTLGGYQGLYVELASPRDISSCHPAPSIWDGRGIYSDGQVDLLWILDVDGQRLVVNAAYSQPRSTASDVDKLTAMAESLEFVAAPG